MNKADQSFNNDFKPIAPPSTYTSDAGWQEKVLFALAQIGEGTAADVAGKLIDLDTQTAPHILHRHAEQILTSLRDKGLIKAHEQDGEVSYNLSKITRPNIGGIDPDLL